MIAEHDEKTAKTSRMRRESRMDDYLSSRMLLQADS